MQMSRVMEDYSRSWRLPTVERLNGGPVQQVGCRKLTEVSAGMARPITTDRSFSTVADNYSICFAC